MDHINNDEIRRVFLFTKPLFETQWTNFLFYHAYVVFRTETIHGGIYWWSLEKNGNALILQMSSNLEDVRDNNEGERRIKKYTTYWRPRVNISDFASMSFSALYDYLIVDTDQLKIKYNLADDNCKKFAKLVFNRIALNKNWNYFESNKNADEI